MDLLLSVIDSVCVVKPAVIGVSLFAVHEGEGLDGLREFVSVLHLDEIKVTTVSLTSVFLLSGAERPTLHALLVFSADSRAGGANLTGGTLKLGVCAPAGPTLTNPSAITDLLVGGEAGRGVQRAVTRASGVVSITDTNPALTTAVSSAEFIVGTVAVEVVALAELAAVAFLRIVSFLALAGAAHTLAIVTADVRAVVLTAILVQVLSGHLVFTTFTLSANTSLIAPAGSTLKCAVAVMAQVAVFDALLVTVTLADEVEGDLDLLGKAQRFNLNFFFFALSGATLSCDINAEGYLISDGDVGAPPSIFSIIHYTVFTV